MIGNGAIIGYADSSNQIMEVSQDNNIGTVTINVGGTLTLAWWVLT
jgi:hypothetical protein